MIETRCLKNVVISFKTILSFVLSRKTINSNEQCQTSKKLVILDISM